MLAGLTLAWALAGPAAAAEVTSERAEAAVRETVRTENGYRLTLHGSAPPGERGDRKGFGERRERSSLDLPAAGAVTFGRVLFWLGVGVVAVLLVAWLVRSWLGHVPPPAPPPPVRPGDETTRPGGGAPPADPELEALLAAGAYGEAVHLLLKAALRRLHGQEPPPALTARAALRTLPLPTDGKRHLGTLVEAVERIRYAGLVADRSLFDRCRAASEALQ